MVEFIARLFAYGITVAFFALWAFILVSGFNSWCHRTFKRS